TAAPGHGRRLLIPSGAALVRAIVCGPLRAKNNHTSRFSGWYVFFVRTPVAYTPRSPCMPDFDVGHPVLPYLQRNRDYMGQRKMGLSDLLLENRIIFFGSIGSTTYEPIISDPLANVTIQQLLYLQYENRNQEIHFYINSPGGSVSATLAIYDTMQFLE